VALGVTSATFGDFVDEVVRLIEAVGVDHVGIGTDMDANFRPVLTDYAEFGLIGEHLSDRGFTPAEVDRVLGATPSTCSPRCAAEADRLAEGVADRRCFTPPTKCELTHSGRRRARSRPSDRAPWRAAHAVHGAYLGAEAVVDPHAEGQQPVGVRR